MSSDLKVDQSDVSRLTVHHRGNDVFSAILHRAVDSRGMLTVLGRYIQFNAIFGSGVSNLAGEVGARSDLFRDPQEPIYWIGDRSSEVAAEIFYAAIDEFGDQTPNRRGTHRSLAQATLQGAARFFRISPHWVNRPGFINRGTFIALDKVRRGYGLNRSMDDRALFHGIGFHIGSETLADKEFCILDEFMNTRYPELVASLDQTKIMVNGNYLPGYHWVRIHTTAEAEHAEAAFHAANKALRFYAGSESRAQARAWIFEGLNEFAAVQTEFMERLDVEEADLEERRMSCA